MKKVFFAACIALLCACTSPQRMIKTPAPPRPAGQSDVLGLTCEKLDTVRVGFIGLGMRGPGAVNRFTHIDGVKITALCDLLPERVAEAQKILARQGLPAAAEYSGEEGWKELCKRDDIDLVYIATPWQKHVPMAVFALQQGKHTAIEVPAATNIDECWQLVDAAEKSRRHCMMLENCVYDFFELTSLNMAQKGLFGEILHVEGAYIHNLEEYWDAYQGDWRLDFNRKNRGDVYATHGLGPACQLLDIHRGDRMTYLVAMDTKAVTGAAIVEKRTGEPCTDFRNADHTMTMIMTENGRTIHLQHDVMTPRPYSRMYQITGTAGFASKYPVEGYTFRPEAGEGGALPDYEALDMHRFITGAQKDSIIAMYKHPIHRLLEPTARKVGGHGGMDYIMDSRLVYCLRNGLPLDQDVYDAAEWSCIGDLTRISLENGSMPVEIPDFTRGGWNKIKGYEHAMAK